MVVAQWPAVAHKSTTVGEDRAKQWSRIGAKCPIVKPVQKWVVCSGWWLVFPSESIVVSTIDSLEVATLEPEKQHGHARD
jgi:hypothetical protein